MHTSLAAYLKKFIVFQPGDWPCQFYGRQIIYKSLKKFVSSHPGFSDASLQQDSILTDYSLYSFPMTSGTTDNLLNNSLPQATSHSSILSTLPTIGPLHISLNSREHIVQSYHLFFSRQYMKQFSQEANWQITPNPRELVWFLILCIVVGHLSTALWWQSSLSSKMQSMGPYSLY